MYVSVLLRAEERKYHLLLQLRAEERKCHLLLQLSTGIVLVIVYDFSVFCYYLHIVLLLIY